MASPTSAQTSPAGRLLARGHNKATEMRRLAEARKAASRHPDCKDVSEEEIASAEERHDDMSIDRGDIALLRKRAIYEAYGVAHLLATATSSTTGRSAGHLRRSTRRASRPTAVRSRGSRRGDSSSSSSDGGDPDPDDDEPALGRSELHQGAAEGTQATNGGNALKSAYAEADGA